MRTLRPAMTALALTFLLMAAGHAEAGDPSAPPAAPDAGATYEKAKGEALDAYIAGRLITAYGLSEHLSPFEIQVAVKDAKVVLSGAVETKVQRDLALEIARGIEQAQDVRSRIVVDPGLRRPEPGAQRGFSRAFADAGITARVKTRLMWNGSTSGLSLDVDTDHHAVTLSGTVDSAVESALAEQIALNTRGVERVENRLQLTPQNDAQLRALYRN